MYKKICEVTAKSHLSPPLKLDISDKHWQELQALNQTLISEYQSRRAMLIKRLDVTISSFNWSEIAKKNLNNIAAAYQSKRHALQNDSNISIAHLLAARGDVSQVCKTSSGATRHKCPINKVVIGKVPDRGGRANEISAPPPEMPSWQKRQTNDKGGRYNSGQRGGSHQHSVGSSRGGGSARGRGQSRWGRGRGDRSSSNQFFKQQFSESGGFGGAQQIYTS
uniref:Uncharacterized protein n=1 Tax=Ciona savignyi TaxID=51511 RepID=H2YT82_CIOSA